MPTTSLSTSPSRKLTLSPVAFARGLLAKLTELKAEKVNFHRPRDKAAMQAVYEIFDAKVNGIKGNDAKSPRYRELLKIRNTLTPGTMQEFGAFRHAMFEAMSEMRQEPVPLYPLTVKSSSAVLEQYSKEDLAIIHACAKAYTVAIKKNTAKA